MAEEKNTKEIAMISAKIVNLLANEKCTVDEAKQCLSGAHWTVEHTSMVQRLNYLTNSNDEKA